MLFLLPELDRLSDPVLWLYRPLWFKPLLPACCLGEKGGGQPALS